MFAEKGGREGGGRIPVADTRVWAGVGASPVLRAAAPLVQLRTGERHNPVEPAADSILPLVALILLFQSCKTSTSMNKVLAIRITCPLFRS